MLPWLSLLHFIFFSLLPPAFSSGQAPDPNCLTHCGIVHIPYPFGVGPGCSLDPSFDIICNNSTEPPKPYLAIRDYMELVEINPSQIRVRKPTLLSAACYDEYGKSLLGTGDEEEWFGFSLRGTQFTFSDENWLTAVGCDDLVLGFGEGKPFGGGCVAYCDDSKVGIGFCPEKDVGYPPGYGCCRTTVAKGISVLAAQLTNLGTKWRDRKRFPCSFAFIQEKFNESKGSSFSYDLSDLNNTMASLDDSGSFKKIEGTVIRLDWRIGAQTCNQARKNSTYYACQDNTDCVDYDENNAKGYLCSCKKGYQGNPYIKGGCPDIDECNGNPCGPHSTCKNSIGSFRCVCNRGYNGDGRLNRSGCTSNIMQIALIGLGAALGLILLLLLCLLVHKVLEKKRKRKRKEDLFKHLLHQQQTSEGAFGRTKLFTAKELAKATDSFNESRICGQGGQGVVYKGMLSDGTIVAIKKLRRVDENQVEQFINEVVILSQINHKNVVRLLGCCLATEEPLLVYEFLSNGTLYDFIHVPKVEFPLTWKMRLKIAADVAGALAYLHSSSSIPIYHRDIKSKNILLDEKHIVKVSDFGISRLVEVDQTHLTTLVKGTFGYLDPEYYQTSQYTDKSDVYSFGVVLVELLTGKRPLSMERSEMARNLASLFLACMQENNLDDILDTQVSEQGEKEEVMAVAKLARRCLNGKGRMRPIMKEVATELESLRISQVPSMVNEQPEEEMMVEGKNMMYSDNEYTWTVGDDGTITSPSIAHPLMCETV